MAEAKKAEGGEGEQPPPKKKSKLLLIIIIAVVALLVIGGGAGYFLMSKKSAQATDEEGDEAPAKEEQVKKNHADAEAPPVFVKLDPPFTVKLQAEAQDAYLQAQPELRVLDAHIGEKIKQYNPEIRHKVLLILAGKKASDLANPQGVQQLANEIRVTINEIIEPAPQRKKGKVAATEPPGDRAGPDDPVQAVLFTSFIVQ
jgi:flagellar protein FliL